MDARSASPFFGRPTKASITLVFLLAALSAWGVSRTPEESGFYAGDDVKAVFIYKFVNYLQWPGLNGTAPVRIGVYGRSGVLKSLQELSRKVTGQNRSITVVGFRSPAEVSRCDILFISAPDLKALSQVISKIGPAGVFTVSDLAAGIPSGICLNFVFRNERIQFEINMQSLRAAGIQASSNLLKLAAKVVGKD